MDGERAALASERTISSGEKARAKEHPGNGAHNERLVRAPPLLRDLQEEEDSVMASGKSDELKGRVKEAGGALTGDKRLKREGKADQAIGKIKQKVKDAVR